MKNFTIEKAWDIYQELSRSVCPTYYYKGMYGSEISEAQRDEVLPLLKTAGVEHVIDLSNDTPDLPLAERCQAEGMDYLHYPIGNSPDAIAHMYAHRHELAERLEGGNFYAMGPGFYVALCVGWLFTMSKEERTRSVEEENYVAYFSDSDYLTGILYDMLRLEIDEMAPQCSESEREEHENQRRKEIHDFFDYDGPANNTDNYSFLDLKRRRRNGSLMFDVSVKTVGTVAYLYAPDKSHRYYEYDIIFGGRGARSGYALDFIQARREIIDHLCRLLPILHPALPLNIMIDIAAWKRR